MQVVDETMKLAIVNGVYTVTWMFLYSNYFEYCTEYKMNYYIPIFKSFIWLIWCPTPKIRVGIDIYQLKTT